MRSVPSAEALARDRRGWHIPRPSREAVEQAVRTLLAWTGDDPGRAGLARTPARVADAYEELFSGYHRDPVALLRQSLLPDPDEGRIVVLRDIPFVSICEHHLLPFTGKAHLGFIARGRIVGIGAIGAALDVLARRLQLQERLTDELAGAVREALEPEAVVVALEATHECMAARGPKLRSRLVTCRQLGPGDGEPATGAAAATLLQMVTGCGPAAAGHHDGAGEIGRGTAILAGPRPL
jgi:GTP cyclohydrolase I